MSEPIWCTITVAVPRSWYDFGDIVDWEPFQYLTDALCNGDTEVIHLDARVALVQFSGEGNYGLIDDQVEAALGALSFHRIPYLAVEDAKYEYVGSWQIVQKREGVGGIYAGEQPLLDVSDALAIQAGTHWASSFEQYRDTFLDGIGRADVSHLPAERPIIETSDL